MPAPSSQEPRLNQVWRSGSGGREPNCRSLPRRCLGGQGNASPESPAAASRFSAKYAVRSRSTFVHVVQQRGEPLFPLPSWRAERTRSMPIQCVRDDSAIARRRTRLQHGHSDEKPRQQVAHGGTSRHRDCAVVSKIETIYPRLIRRCLPGLFRHGSLLDGGPPSLGGKRHLPTSSGADCEPGAPSRLLSRGESRRELLPSTRNRYSCIVTEI